MFDPEKVETAAALQRKCEGWFIFWSPGLRAFTAIAGFVPGQAVLINEPFTHGLLRRIGAIEFAVSVGAPITDLIDMGAQRRTEARAGGGFAAEADRAVRPPKPRGRHAPGGGHAPGPGMAGEDWGGSAGAPPRIGPAGRAARSFVPRRASASTA